MDFEGYGSCNQTSPNDQQMSPNDQQMNPNDQQMNTRDQNTRDQNTRDHCQLSSKGRQRSVTLDGGKRASISVQAESSLLVSGSVYSGHGLGTGAGSVYSSHGLGTGAGSIGQKCVTKSTPSFTKRQLLVLLCFAYGNFWIAACVSLQAPFFPAEAERKGASATVYGAIFGVYELMIITCSPLFSKLIRWVTPNFIVESGLLVCGVSTILFGVLDHVPSGASFISLAFIVRIFEGIGAAAFLNASYTIMAVEFPDKVPTTFAMLETCFGLGLILGPTVGGALYEWVGYSLPFISLGSFLLLGGVLTFCCLPSSGELASTQPLSIWSFLSDWSTILDALATATTLNFIGFNAATLEPQLRQFGLSPVLTGCIFILTGAVYAATSPIMGRIVQSGFNPKTLCLLGCLFCLGGIAFLGPLSVIDIEPQLWLVIVSLLTIGLGHSAKLVAGFISCMSHTINVRGYPDDIGTYGLVSALFFSSCSVGAFTGPVLGGYFLDVYGYRDATWLLFVVEAILVVMMIAYKIREHLCPPQFHPLLLTRSII